MTDIAGLTRKLWHQLEPLHAFVYFAPQAAQEGAALGYDAGDRWPWYFALRSAPLGPVAPEVVTASFYSFSARTVASYVPGVWRTAAPRDVLEARMRGVDRTLKELLGGGIDAPDIAEAAELARTAAEAAELPGRPLAAANAALPWPEEPHLVLWQATTVLREHRGDGHLAALLAAGLDGCEALVSFAGIGAAPRANFASRGCSEREWDEARERLTARGWLDASGTATDRGRSERDEIERRTDELAAGPYRALGTEGCARLAELTGPLLGAVLGAGMLPSQSTLGILTVQAPGPRPQQAA